MAVLPDYKLYQESVNLIARQALDRFGATALRLWTADLAAFVREQARYSSWTVSAPHADFVCRTRLSRVVLIGPASDKHEGAQLFMLEDVKVACERLAEENQPVTWKILFVTAKRYAVIADLGEEDDDQRDLQELVVQREYHKDNLEAVEKYIAIIRGQYTKIGIAPPELRPIPFNAAGKEISS